MPVIVQLVAFLLACGAGVFLVRGALPLKQRTTFLSLASAISAVVIVGAIALVGPKEFSSSRLLGMLAVFFASAAVFASLILTQRLKEGLRGTSGQEPT
ncbi:MAG: NAD(P) transhydrogenase subunit alpha [Alphaproteobacteria bacterium]|nr:NAD(P) transhydrogenase subunit alpha [Alphaproteobacteria bacterium]